jgi:hypothetical protein
MDELVRLIENLHIDEQLNIDATNELSNLINNLSLNDKSIEHTEHIKECISQAVLISNIPQARKIAILNYASILLKRPIIAYSKKLLFVPPYGEAH